MTPKENLFSLKYHPNSPHIDTVLLPYTRVYLSSSHLLSQLTQVQIITNQIFWKVHLKIGVRIQEVYVR